MKLFNVEFYYGESGRCIVEANSTSEAEEIMQKRLEEYGIDNLNLKTLDRDYGITGSEQINSNSHIKPNIKYEDN